MTVTSCQFPPSSHACSSWPSAVCSRCCSYETMTRQDGDACTQSRSATRAERAVEPHRIHAPMANAAI